MAVKVIPPKARKRPKELITHKHKRIDNYYWLNNKDNHEVIQFLEKENEYTEAELKDYEKLKEKIFNEIISKIKQEDMSVPYRKKGYYYYTRYEEKKEYPVYCRKEKSLENEEEILLDVNILAHGKKYYDVKGISISPDNRYLAFGVDETGRRKYSVFLKNLSTGEIKVTTISNTTGTIVWAGNSKTVYFSVKDDVTLRASKIFRTDIFKKESIPDLIYEELDETFSTSVYKTKSEKYIIIGSHSTLSDEYRILEADNINGNFRIFQHTIAH